MERIIYNHLTSNFIILDNNNKIIENIILDSFKIKDIDFNKLPSNIYSKVEIYIGKEFETYKFELNVFKEFLFGENVFKNKDDWFWNNKIQLYTFDNKNQTLVLSDQAIMFPYSRKFKYNRTLVRRLCGGLIGHHYNFNIDIVF